MSLDLEALQNPITRILTAPGTDLSTISARRVRKTLLQDPAYAFLGLTPELLKSQRADVDQVIAQIFEQVNQAAGGAKRKREDEEVDGPQPIEPSEGAGEGDDGDVDEVSQSPKKKKNKKSLEESDAALARKLSTEINSRSRRGASLAAGVSSPRKAKRRAKKSAETVNSEDEDEPAKPKKRSAPRGGFGKEYTLSDPLSAVLAVEKLSRPQVVKKLWEYIRQHQLQNPLNRKEIVCDDALRAVFAVDKIDMFRMNKVLGQHLHEG